MSQLLDREVIDDTALVIDANPLSRSVMVQHLRGFGFATVKQVGRISDAREMLENRPFELVVCDTHFDNGGSGQELLDELRREQLLPYATVFVMVTGQATYARVAEAADAALDSYLVKPFSGSTLFDRIKEARRRKRVLKDVFDAIEAKALDRAIALCLARFAEQKPYGLYASRIGAELLLTQKRNTESQKVYEAVAETHAAPWARLGVARALLADGHLTPARRKLDALLSEEPHFTDLYDVLGKVQVEQGEMAEALTTYRTVTTLTPSCILRLQHCGTLNFYVGSATEGIDMLERTWVLGQKSRLLDMLSVLLLTFMRFDAKDSKGTVQGSNTLQRFSDKFPDSARLRRMAELGLTLVALTEGKPAIALKRARAAFTELPLPDYDMEAATNMLSLLSRLKRHGLEDAEYQSIAHAIAERFAVSKASTEVLIAAAQSQPAVTAWLRATYAEVMRTAEDAMQLAMAGHPKAAVSNLLERGSATGNAKLIEMAGLVAQRHQERIEGVEEIVEDTARLAQLFCAPTTQLAGVRRSNRAVGGLVLRR